MSLMKLLLRCHNITCMVICYCVVADAAAHSNTSHKCYMLTDMDLCHFVGEKLAVYHNKWSSSMLNFLMMHACGQSVRKSQGREMV